MYLLKYGIILETLFTHKAIIGDFQKTEITGVLLDDS